jgi:hypothetical protein
MTPYQHRTTGTSTATRAQTQKPTTKAQMVAGVSQWGMEAPNASGVNVSTATDARCLSLFG